MWELMSAGGFLMWPLLVTSILTLAIIIERFWALRYEVILPEKTLSRALAFSRSKGWDKKQLLELAADSALGRLCATIIAHQKQVDVKEHATDAGRHIVHELKKHLSTLNTIVNMAPLLGLLGTVIGMIQVFSQFITTNTPEPSSLAGGLSTALITTAFGMMIAIPALLAHRFFSNRVEYFSLQLEKQALFFLESVSPTRQAESPIEENALMAMARK